MRLERLEGMRGRVRAALDLAPTTYVVGPNESGKSTTLDLVAFGVNGPGRDRIPSDTSVVLTFDAAKIARAYRPSQNGDDKTEHLVSVYEGGRPVADRVRTAEREIARLVGHTWTWSADGLFASTAIERRKLITQLIGPALTVQRVAEALGEVGMAHSQLPSSIRTRMRSTYDAVKRKPPEAGIEFASEWLAGLREAKNACQREAQQLVATLATVRQRLEAAKVPEGSAVEIRGRLDVANDKLVELRARRQAAETSVRLRAELERRHVKASNTLALPPVELDRELVELRDRLPELEAALTAAASTAAEGRQAEAQARAEFEAAVSQLSAAASTAGAAWTLRGILTQARDRLRYHEDGLADELTMLIEDAGSTAPKRVQAIADAARAKHGAAARRAAEAVEAARLAESTVVRARVRMKHLDDLHRMQLDNRERDTTRAQVELEEVRREIETLPEAIGMDTLDVQIAAAQSEVTALHLLIEGLQTYTALAADAERTALLSAEASEDRSALHRIEQTTEAALAKLYADAVAPLVEPASRITQAVLGEPTVIDPSLGWWLGVGQTPVEHLSASTQAVLGVAVRTAVLSLRSGWRALLLDNAEAVEDSRRLRLLRALAEAGLDNVVVAAVDDGIYPDPAIAHTIQLTRPEDR